MVLLWSIASEETTVAVIRNMYRFLGLPIGWQSDMPVFFFFVLLCDTFLHVTQTCWGQGPLVL